jgi:hypothetical protein
MEEVKASKTPNSALDVDVATGEVVELHPDGNHAVRSKHGDYKRTISSTQIHVWSLLHRADIRLL